MNDFERKRSRSEFAIVLVRLLSLALLLFTSATAGAASQSVTLAWDPSSETNVVGYIVYMGTASGYYPVANDVGQATNATVSGLQPGGIYYFVVTAYTDSGLESAPTDESVYQVPDLAPKPQIYRNADTVSVKFSTTSGRIYVMEYKNSLDEPRWTPLTSVAGTDGIMTVSDTSSDAPARFYRVGVH